MLDGTIDTLHFDEAWLPHATFHKFYHGMHAIGQGRPRTKESVVFSTQSTHKLLAGLSQASQILVQDSETRKLDYDTFNEAYLMHTSTSPQYAIIASCDVAAAMMEAPGGTALVEESIMEALDFRRAMRKVDAEFGKDWWFKVWGPERLSDEGVGNRDDWMLRPSERWHGFGNLAPGFNMLDPIKATVITPGLDVTGKFANTGIPAAVVTKGAIWLRNSVPTALRKSAGTRPVMSGIDPPRPRVCSSERMSVNGIVMPANATSAATDTGTATGLGALMACTGAMAIAPAPTTAAIPTVRYERTETCMR